MRILLTGSSGFIGKKLLNQFADRYGRENIILLSSKKNKYFQTITYRDHDFFIPPNVVNNIDLIFHAGAFIPKDASNSDSIKKCNSNIYFTEKLLNHPWESLKRVVFLGTIDVYDSSSDAITEATNIKPSSLYGMSKLYCEQMIKAFCKERKILDLVLRIGHVYGPGEEKYKKIIPITIQKFLKNEPVELWGDGTDTRSFIFIDDVVRACATAVDKENLNGVINVASSKSVSIREIINKISSAVREEFTLITKKRSSPKRDLKFDTRKMRETILFHETDILEGLKMEVEHFRGLA